MDQVISSIENNIKKCDILNNVLKSKMAGEAIDLLYYKRLQRKAGFDRC